MKKIWFVTHEDLDGMGCGILTTLAYKNVDISYVSNFEIDNKVDELITGSHVSPHDDIFFADICPSENSLKRLNSYFPFQIEVFDHHKTNTHATDILGSAGIVKWDKDENGRLSCGTSVLHEYLISHQMYDESVNMTLLNEFVEQVRLYDTYQWKEQEDIAPKKLQALFTMLGGRSFVKKYVTKLKDPNASLFDEIELEFIDARIEQELKSINEFISTKKHITDVDINGLRVALAFHPGGMNVSELSYRFLSENTEYDMMVIMNMTYSSLNFRVFKEGIDAASTFAKPLKGGGHPKACGCAIPNEIQDRYMNEIISYLKSAMEVTK